MNNLIGFIVALGLGLSMLSYVGDTNTDTANLHLARASAEYSKVVSQATQQYITDNYDAVLANATATKPAVITISMLKASNHLPSSISDKNPYGQTYTAYAIKPQAGNLQSMLVSSGGNTISEGQLLQISKMVGSQGGYISQKTPSIVNGTFGGWSMPLSSYQLSSNPGHLATALFFVSGQVSNDYLYRSSVTGHPELNRMNTALDMASNDVNNAGKVNAGTVNTTGETYTGGWFRTTGDGGVYFQKYGGGIRMTDTNTISTYGGKSIASENDVTAGRNVTATGTVQGGYVKSTGNIDASGTATAGQVVSKGRVTAGEFLQLNQVAVAGAACSPNGLVGRDSVGGILSCQSGVWNSGLKIGFFSVASPVGVNNITWARYCALGHYGQGGGSQIYPVAGPDGEGKYLWQTNTLGGAVMINCF
ncbi:shufflon system plasmid conjugative transfer pilus tip adhesin PilV [Citrobacter freundii]|uniref:shufflon system plasmid conjugative transfer pilus tip adhesin PilV n=2 Tax=Enterobacteriaceae TaxID=543 RepID=UPI001903C764|nr:shufflon system plasmid conjugative transfer pilus tip adhesin PilV [Citrobacter freundii]MBJ8931630.1 shufflon system plasmid conjugative transfer pilus tip adhesin PilV [Citrobacter freundii]